MSYHLGPFDLLCGQWNMNQKNAINFICVYCFLSKAKVLIINYDVKIIITKKTPILYKYVHIYIGYFYTKISFLEKNLVSVFCQLQHISHIFVLLFALKNSNFLSHVCKL